MVEGARLESVCRGNPTEGSNPSLSAKLRSRSFAGARRLQATAPLAPSALVATRLESPASVNVALARLSE